MAYYGAAETPALGVLGERGPDATMARLRAAAAPFASPGRPILPAYELIVTIADRHPGPDGNYSHPVSDSLVQRYVDAGRRLGALVILDVQPGRSPFLPEVRRYERYLTQPHVGLALDPEWRVGPGQVPGRTIGSVRAAEINAVSAYLSGIVARDRLPEKLLLLHQFRTSMIPDAGLVARRPGLEIVQHLDGFGSRGAKDATAKRVGRPWQFRMGYKLFYDEDIDRYTPREVLAFRPPPDYVSYQ